MTKTVAILQSNYIPWRGYFDLMRRCQVFILYDIVQYTKEDWRNRNIVKTEYGSRWLTIPVHYRSRNAISIDETTVADPHWARDHVNVIKQYYRQAAAFAEVSPWLFELLKSQAAEPLLSRINTRLIVEIAAHLGITTRIVHCTELVPRPALVAMDRMARLIALCQAAGAARYMVGPAAKSYLDESMFRAQGIDVAWMSYEGYREYPQLGGSFEPKVSIVDLLLNMGASATAYLSPVAECASQEASHGKAQVRDDGDGGCEAVSTEMPGK
jgi:hypothetical protein